MKKLLLLVPIFVLMSTVGVYAGSSLGTASSVVGAPNTGPLVIGFSMEGSSIEAVTVTWTPAAEGRYKIQAIAGSALGVIIAPVDSLSQRTDFVPISSLDVKDLNTVKVAIVEG